MRRVKEGLALAGWVTLAYVASPFGSVPLLKLLYAAVAEAVRG